jgi:hypothetical protein
MQRLIFFLAFVWLAGPFRIFGQVTEFQSQPSSIFLTQDGLNFTFHVMNDNTHIVADIYTLSGKHVDRVLDKIVSRSNYSFRPIAGRNLPNGGYIIRLSNGTQSISIRAIKAGNEFISNLRPVQRAQTARLAKQTSLDSIFVMRNVVQDFANRHRNNSTTVFRSGLLDNDTIVKRFSDPAFGDAAFNDSGYDLKSQNQKWHEGNCEEYMIDYSKDQNIVSGFAVRHPNLQIIFDTLTKEYRITPKTVTTKSVRLTVQQLLTTVDSMFQSLCPSLKKHCEYDTYSILNKNDTMYNIIVRYRRIFKSGIVRNNASSVNIQADFAGNIVTTFIVWPKFVKVSGLQDTSLAVKLDVGVIGSVMAILQSVNTNLQTQFVQGLTKTKLAHGEISGVSLGWFNSNVDPIREILTPCYSFSTNVTYSDSSLGQKTIDVPVLKKYYSK